MNKWKSLLCLTGLLAVSAASPSYASAPNEASTKRLAYFCDTYDKCRDQFLRAGSALVEKLSAEDKKGIETGSWKVPSKTDNNLITDWIYLPAKTTTKNLILVTSGTHGVEGFMGSAVQKYLFEEVLPKFNRDTTGVILVHAINPYGFKNLRRVSENNVDLNRNFDVTRDLFKYHNAGYAKLDYLLNPPYSVSYTYWSGAGFLARVAKLLATEKLSTLRNATLNGQYEYPKGIYFGGKDFEPQKDLVEKLMDDKARPYRAVMHLDLHTGYGTKGFMHLFPSEIKDAAVKKAVHQIFAGYPIDEASGDGDFYEAYGDFSAYTMNRMLQLKKKVVPMVLEYGTNNNQGTRGGVESLRMSIVENQLHHYGTTSLSKARQIKRDFLELYLPKSKAWRLKTMDTTAKWLPVFLERFAKYE